MRQLDAIGRTVDYAAGRNRYIGYLISLATRSYKGKKVGLDCANGSTWMMAKSVFDALGADTFVINNHPDGLNINVDCGSTHIEHLQKYVLDNGLDVGFAFVGDADRCLAVEREGQGRQRRSHPLCMRKVHAGARNIRKLQGRDDHYVQHGALQGRSMRSASAMKRPLSATSTSQRTCARTGTSSAASSPAI